MKKICTLLLTAGMLMGVALVPSTASAIDFKAKGQWIVGFGLVDVNWMDEAHKGGEDTFQAQQRVRLQIDAVASEALSATVYFEIGEQKWGSSAAGASIGTDGIAVEVKQAYIDWFVPNTMLSFRMGLQGVVLPNTAGGSAILDDDTAAVLATYKFNDMVSLTLGWLRPINDNFDSDSLEVIRGMQASSGYPTPWLTNYNDHGDVNYLDNMDLFLLSLPITGENWSVNPWLLVGWYGDNVFKAYDPELYWNYDTAAPSFSIYLRFGEYMSGLIPLFAGSHVVTSYDLGPGQQWNESEDEYTAMWWAGIPITFQHEGWNIELDFNYGSVGYSGTYDAQNLSYFNYTADELRSEMTRSGWLIKGLVEYKMDWGTPGLFAWYGSGDNDDVSDGSEMMPFISPSGNFTSFLGDGEVGWQPGAAYDQMLNYSGTWGVGLQIKDLSFVENLSHIIRVAYWGGTNDPDMVRFVYNPYAYGGFYMVEGDYLVELNFDTTYQMYENFAMHVQLGYVFNGIDSTHWNNHRDSRVEKVRAADGYKATLTFEYSF